MEGGNTLSSQEMVIPIMLLSLRMISNTLDPSMLPERPNVRSEAAKTGPWTGLRRGWEKSLIADLVTPGDGVHFLEEAASEFSVTWKLREDF